MHKSKKLWSFIIVFIVISLILCAISWIKIMNRFIEYSKTYPERTLSKMLGINIPNGDITEVLETHGGFHGDGSTILSVSFNESNIEEKISQNTHWHPLPMSPNVEKALHQFQNSYSSELNILNNNNGYYFFYDRNYESKDPYDDTELFSRFSYNFTIAIYDCDANLLYIFKEDT